MNVLVVDDNQFDAFQTTTSIKACFKDAHVVHVDCSKEALREVTTHAAAYYDTIIVDQHMPCGLGADLGKRLGEILSGTKTQIIMLTSDYGDLTRSQALAYNFDGFLVKPVSNKRLTSLLDGSRSCWELSELPKDLSGYRSFMNASRSKESAY